ncbi:MAG: hypothetical protein M0Q51_16465 [Bacteroidales bacterium]|nr:hypothetical protein [Bacteroidales bacterium]
MKKVLKIIMFVFLVPLTSKEQIYVPFPDSNAIWSEVLTDMQPFEIQAYQYGISGDTSFNSTWYKKVYLLNDTVYPLVLGQYCCAIREDSLKRIYAIDCQCCFQPLSGEEEVILYDFSKSVGDTVLVGLDGTDPLGGYYVIDYIDSVLIDGNYRKTYHFVDYDYLEYWIEGIGSTRGLFSPLTPVTTGSLKWELICFNQDGIVKYLNPVYNSCFPILTEINERETVIDPIKLCPNPVSDVSILDLSLSNQDFTILEIYDALGINTPVNF